MRSLHRIGTMRYEGKIMQGTHIVRLQITKDDVLAVQIFESIGNLKATVQSLGQKAVPSLALPIKDQPAVLAS